MRSSVRQITVILLLTVLLAPGLLQARTPARHGVQARAGAAVFEAGFFGVVWNLLTGFFGGDSGSLLKTGSQLDPAGSTTPGSSGTTSSTSTTTTDTGSQLDPAGQP
jgi:hypothetical protein